MDAFDQVMQNKASRQAFLAETAILRMTNLFARLLGEHKFSQRQLADKMGVSEGRVAQIMDGVNLTLSTVAKTLGAFDCVLHVDCQPIEQFSSANSWRRIETGWTETKSDTSIIGRLGFLPPQKICNYG